MTSITKSEHVGSPTPDVFLGSFSHNEESSLTTRGVVGFMNRTGARIELADMNDGFITKKRSS
jgi:hypothetical protein